MTAPGEIPEATGRRRHGVWVGLALGAIVILLAAGAFWGGFVLGARSLGAGPFQALQDVQRERDTLTAQLAELKQQGIACERNQQIEDERARSAQEQLKAAQDERLTLAKEIFSLKRLIRKGGRGVVAVQDLRLAAGDAEREFRYSFSVTQLIEDVGETAGTIDIKLSGTEGGKDKTLNLKDLKGSQPIQLSMAFDHTQTFEGHLVLPAGFEPQQLTIEIDPQGDKVIASAETFAWRLGE